MPLHLRLQASWMLNSALPRDRVQINPCFRIDNATIQDADSLCENLADTLSSWYQGTGELLVKSYDLEGTPPVQPNGTAIRRQGEIGNYSNPRELAICMSFYGGTNLPRNRGRLYLPVGFCGVSDPDLRPTDAAMTAAENLGGLLAGLGGANVDWIVWSPTHRAATGITTVWVDDEWDVQRRRGLRQTKRLSFNV